MRARERLSIKLDFQTVFARPPDLEFSCSKAMQEEMLTLTIVSCVTLGNRLINGVEKSMCLDCGLCEKMLRGDCGAIARNDRDVVRLKDTIENESVKHCCNTSAAIQVYAVKTRKREHVRDGMGKGYR